MVAAVFQVYGIGDDHHVVMSRSSASPEVVTQYAESWVVETFASFGTADWYAQNRGVQAELSGARLLDVDTVPANQGDAQNFGLPSVGGTVLSLPLNDSEFLVAQGIFVYVTTPDSPGYSTRLTLSNTVNYRPVAMSRQGDTARVAYATRGNTTRDLRVITVDLSEPLSGTVNLLAAPSYGSSIAGPAPWQVSEDYLLNWYTGLFPLAMGAFEYCTFCSADRTGDGQIKHMLGVAIGSPYVSGGETLMAGYQVDVFESVARFQAVTIGGVLSGANLTAQSILEVPIADSSTVLNSAPGIDPVDYYVAPGYAGLGLSFEPLPGPPAFWTNLRLAVEVI